MTNPLATPPPAQKEEAGAEGAGIFLGREGGEVAFPFKGALETDLNTCGKQERQQSHSTSFYTRFAANLEPCGVRMKDNELSVHVNMHESIV